MFGFEINMQVQLININKISFKSQNVPIEPFSIKAGQDELFVKELTSFDLVPEAERYNISKFFIDNFIDGSEDPEWKMLSVPENGNLYEKQIVKYKDFMCELFAGKDKNRTILLSRNPSGDVKAGIIAFSFVNEIKGLDDPKSFYIESIAVDKAYRNKGVATNLINKILETTTGIFSDALLTGYNKAVPLYKKLGFKTLNTKNQQIALILKEIIKTRDDIPDYTTFMTKILDPKAQRWWKRLL